MRGRAAAAIFVVLVLCVVHSSRWEGTGRPRPTSKDMKSSAVIDLCFLGVSGCSCFRSTPYSLGHGEPLENHSYTCEIYYCPVVKMRRKMLAISEIVAEFIYFVYTVSPFPGRLLA